MTKERAKRLASAWASGGTCSLKEGEASEYHKMFHDLLCETGEKSDWISVEDELPTLRVFPDEQWTPVEYIVILLHGVEATVACIDENDQWFFYDARNEVKEYLYNSERVLYWKPMPEVPKNIKR